MTDLFHVAQTQTFFPAHCYMYMCLADTSMYVFTVMFVNLASLMCSTLLGILHFLFKVFLGRLLRFRIFPLFLQIGSESNLL